MVAEEDAVEASGKDSDEGACTVFAEAPHEDFYEEAVDDAVAVQDGCGAYSFSLCRGSPTFCTVAIFPFFCSYCSCAISAPNDLGASSALSALSAISSWALLVLLALLCY